MFREPEAVAVKTVAKADPTAPARSAIRRQRSVRYPSRNSREQQLSSRPRSHRHHDRFLEAMSRHETGRPRSSVERAFDIEASADQAHAEASRRRRLESGRPTLRDALSYEHPRRSTDMPRDHSYPLSMVRPPLPSTSSLSYSSRRPRHRSVVWEDAPGHSSPRVLAGRVRTPPPAYIPSPPYSSGDGSDRHSPDTLRPVNRSASLTPRFAPAHPLPDIASITGPARIHHYERNQEYEQETTDDSMTNELPPLLRSSRRRHPFSRQGTRPETSRRHIVDGLGDRWRSVSPDDESWDTLLSTMPPDERLPSSASTSFRSTDEDLAYFDSLARISAESMAEAMEMYPVHCENTDTEFSEADETLREMAEGPIHDAPRQVPALPDREPAEVRDSRRYERERL
ncbi:MAG: hypothetical protein L6R39_000821 [Caloplaca ligustica]|nr:MAG: hypothetical protein L6R39_000821 [Caloplaca ligustica]